MINYLFSKNDYIKFGLEFLDGDGLVNYDSKSGLAHITPKGFSKIKNDTFSDEIFNKKVNLWLQRATWFCSICALFISAYSLWSKNISSASQFPCCQTHYVLESNQVQNNKNAPLEKKAKLIQKQQIFPTN